MDKYVYLYKYIYIHVCIKIYTYKKNTCPKKLTWWGWGFRFCRHISGKHRNGPYKKRYCLNKKFSGLQNPNTQPHFCWAQPELLQNPNHGNPPRQKLGSNTPSKLISETNGFCMGNLLWGLKTIQFTAGFCRGSSFHLLDVFLDVFWMCLGCLLDIFSMSRGCLLDVFWLSLGRLFDVIICFLNVIAIC